MQVHSKILHGLYARANSWHSSTLVTSPGTIGDLLVDLWRRRKTLRVRFALWVAGLLLAALLAFGVFVFLSMARSLAGAVDETLQLSAAQAIAAVNIEDGQVSFGDSIPEPGDVQGRGLTIRILDLQGHVRQAAGLYHDLPVDQASLTAALQGQSTFVTQRNAIHRERIRLRTAPIIEDNQVIAVVQVAQSLADMDDTLRRLVAALLISVPLLVVVAGLGGYLLAARALRPIDTIIRTARQISAEDLQARLNLPATEDEVGRLASTFDAMLARLDDSFQRERRFTADASHELRTPLAAMQTILSVIRTQRRTPEDYERALDDLTGETERLRGLVEDLLRLARGDVRPSGGCAPVDLSTLIEDVVETMRPLAEDQELTMICAIAPALVVRGDRDDLIRLFLNALDNAVKYTVQGSIAVHATRCADTIEVCIHDTGSGIAPEHLPHVFDRFYRADTARSQGGPGLGLAIAEEIARAHGGTITVRSTLGVGTTVTVALPGSF
jgi:heavy metal sensor kinase